jgi:hypothetical protein
MIDVLAGAARDRVLERPGDLPIGAAGRARIGPAAQQVERGQRNLVGGLGIDSPAARRARRAARTPPATPRARPARRR